MCGIAGFYKLNNSRINFDTLIKKLNNSINHRGPDNSGYYKNYENSLYLTHTRLSIQDLTPHGNQPMKSFSNRYVLIFNGEIYNHFFLRAKINKKYHFKGRSDTETLIALIEIYGLIKTLEIIDGMFAFCLYDQKLNKIYLVRDRFGEKPLYYNSSKSLFMFSSELKSFLNHKFINYSIDDEVLKNYFNYGFTIKNKSIYKNIFQLQPGCILEIDLSTKKQRLKSYWELKDSYLNRKKYDDFSLNTIDELDSLLEKSVKSRMLSDAPLGIFLSGGIDSSLISYYASKNSTKKIKTYSISFDDKNFDESFYSQRISQFLGTEHYDYKFQSSDIVDIVRKLPDIYNEPFSDPASIPLILLSKFVSKDVKVALSGDGADELFYGYNRYKALLLDKFISKHNKYHLISFLNFIKIKNVNNLIRYLPRKIAIKNIDDKISVLLSLLTQNDENISHLLSKNEVTTNWLRGDISLQNVTKNLILDKVETSNFVDLITYLPNDLLLKTDRASMAYSLEVRLPFLSRDLLDFSLRYRYKNHCSLFKNKIFLRKLSNRIFPSNIVNRPKMGFGLPIANLLRKELKKWGEELIHTKTIDKFNYGFYKKIWNDHQSMKNNYHHMLWKFLIFQNWYCSTYKR